MSEVEVYKTLRKARKVFAPIIDANVQTYEGVPTPKQVLAHDPVLINAADLVVPVGVFRSGQKYHTVMSVLGFGDFPSTQFEPDGCKPYKVKSSVRRHWRYMKEEFQLDMLDLKAIPRYWTVRGHVGVDPHGDLHDLSDILRDLYNVCPFDELPDLFNT